VNSDDFKLSIGRCPEKKFHFLVCVTMGVYVYNAVYFL